MLEHSSSRCGGLVGLLLAAVACAPSQSFRPAAALPPGAADELGLGLSSVGPRPYVNERAQTVAQGWWTRRLGQRWALSALVSFDESALAAGAGLRRDIVRSGPFTAAAEAELGFGWAALSVPLSLRLLDAGELYCSPRLGNWGPALLTPFVPFGVGIDLPQGLALRAEAQVSWADFESYNRRWHLGLGVAQRW